MNPILRNVLAFVGGWIAVNIGLVTLGHKMFPIEGVDPNDMEALSAVMPTLSAEYFLFPWLAHALGTLVGAYVVARFAASHHMKLALGIGAFFFLGGVMVSTMIDSPTWFLLADLALAYFPMAWIGGKLASGQS